MISSQPFLPALRHLLAARKPARPCSAPAQTGDYSALARLFQRFFPAYFLSQNDEGPFSRERCWTLRRTFWTFLFQVLHPGASCRQAIHAAFCSDPDPKRQLPTESSYNQARKALDLDVLSRVQNALALKARQMAPPSLAEWKGWNLKVVDGTSSSMPDTDSNQKAWPQPSEQKKGCGFPVMKWAGLFCLASGAMLAMARGSLRAHELRLFQQFWDCLKPKDLVIADRGFSSYAMYALLQLKGMAAVFRFHQTKELGKARTSRRKRIKRLGKGDCLIEWRKPLQQAAWMDPLGWFQLPETITLRLVTVTVKAKHCRARRITIATTLLDPAQYPASEIAALYARRWEVEVMIRHIKTTMKMDVLRCKTSGMIEKEAAMHQIAYNLVICLILESAAAYWMNPLSISYAGALSVVQACAKTGRLSKRKQKRLEAEALDVIALQLLPGRPGRKEPRAVKRRPKPYSLLTAPRKKFVEIPHRGKYKANKGSKLPKP